MRKLLSIAIGLSFGVGPLSAQETKPAGVVITLGEQVVVSQASPEVRGWGPWQFPHIERLADGRLHIDYHIEADSAKAYGKPVGHAYSTDEGKTWKLSKEHEGVGGLLLPDGDRIRPYTQESIPVGKLHLPQPVHTIKGTYNVDYALYPVATLPPELRGYRIQRLAKGATEWIAEIPKVTIPDGVNLVTEGVFAFASFDRNMVHWHLAPDGSIVVVTYPMRRVAEADRAKLGEYKMGVVLLRSADQGRTWTTLGEIPYQPDPKADPHWAKRDGFSEPDICFLPDGSVFCLIRTVDGNGIGPLYSSRSADGGKSWDKPVVFDELGAWPVLLSLKSGITLASYGRPGLYVRATGEPAAKSWARATLVAPLGLGQDTCSYSDLLPLDDHTALVEYSNFNWPDAQGVKRKTILVRTVTAKRSP